MLKEAQEVVAHVEKGVVRDAALIASAQRIEHYEMSAYGTARTFAELLGYDHHASLLQATLDEESAADSVLSEIAVTDVNHRALGLSEASLTNGGSLA